MDRAQTKLIVTRPKGCDKTALSLDAMDTRTKELAWKTFLTVDRKMLSCAAFKLLANGRLQIEVMPEAFELTNFDV